MEAREGVGQKMEQLVTRMSMSSGLRPGAAAEGAECRRGHTRGHIKRRRIG
jgi:hypothetical protein